MKSVVSSWILVIGLVGCQPTKKVSEEIAVLPPAQPIISFSGDTLPQKSFPDSIYQVLLTNMMEAKQLSEQYPDSAELAIWHGRRVAYMGRYHEAIEVFSEALKKFPNDHRLLRHRGHRYITTRQIDLAITDYERANALAEKAANAIEPDGIPNKLNKPLSNDKFNIYYHQGLAYYLKGEFEKAITVYRQCMEVSDNDDLKVATSYWLYMTLHRLGMEEEASKLLDTVTADMSIVENDAYLDLLMLFKEAISVDELLEKVGSADVLGNPTLMYGLGNWHLQHGSFEEANRVYSDVLKQKSWDSFGYIAAEAGIGEIAELLKKVREMQPMGVRGDFIMADLSYFENCQFDLGCDYCFGNMKIEGTHFEYIDICEGNTVTTEGRVHYEKGVIILTSNQKRSVSEYNWDYLEDKSQQQYVEYDTLLPPLVFQFELKRCNGIPYLSETKHDKPLIISASQLN